MPSPKPLNLTDELQRKFSAEVLSVLQEVGKVASQMGMTAYAVGGFVRDLLLGTPTLDIDIVVEGNGISLAQKLAQMWQADLTVHERFFTATLQWRLKEPVSTIASAHACILSRLDIATARKERYPSPAALPEVEPASILEFALTLQGLANSLTLQVVSAICGEASSASYTNEVSLTTQPEFSERSDTSNGLTSKLSPKRSD
jgi:tRNA nucleotidyltransferase (CCA-adding enzyme)